MEKVRTYQANAKECRALAATAATAELRAPLLTVAEHWEMLAQQRIQYLALEASPIVEQLKMERAAEQLLRKP
jgi:hypothetical protein